MMRRMIASLALLVACVDPAGSTDSTAPVDDTGEEEVDPNAHLRGTAPLATVSGGACPAMEAGKVELVSNELDRSVKLLIPESGAEGKGVIFAWYPLGGSSSWLINALNLDAWVEDNDMVVVVPNASGGQAFEWSFMQNAEGNDDLVLYDDVRTCLYEELGVDLGRVSSAGFSAGALWTSYLSLYRGDTLATILPFSGGTDPVITYETPASDFPALLPYGGTSDTYGGNVVRFYETQANFAASLTADGHFVVLCDHDLGHTIPPEGIDMMTAWLPAHTYGQPSPFVGDISALPDYCWVAEG
jgi:poly(3-hydroxybutyrate) depolymerase